MNKALELWKELIEYIGSPWVTDDYGRTECFFCVGDRPNHYEDCFYVRALKLIEEEQEK